MRLENGRQHQETQPAGFRPPTRGAQEPSLRPSTRGAQSLTPGFGVFGSIVVPLALALLLAVAAAADGSCTGIEVRAGSLLFADGFESGDTAAWGSSDPRFSVTRILDLDLETRFADGFTGDHLLHLKLVTPKGHHYQTLTVPVATDAALRGTGRRVDGYPRPLAVRLAEPAAGEGSTPAVSVELPVGGTAIVSSSLYGRWAVEATLDDETAICADAVFYLYP